ncbi:chitin deacetylase [Podila horticola]|nr:chitin deacetylase [Podila horticola]
MLQSPRRTLRDPHGPRKSSCNPPHADYLKAERLKVTFILVDSNSVQWPDIVRCQFAKGHHLASHTWSHKGLTTLTNEQMVAAIKWTETAVRQLTGQRLKYVRPPYSDIDDWVRFVLKKLGYTNLDNNVAGGRNKGVISLEHDLDMYMENLHKKLVPLGRARGITIMDVTGCKKDRFPYLEP